MAVKVAINGFGRIGRLVVRQERRSKATSSAWHGPAMTAIPSESLL